MPVLVQRVEEQQEKRRQMPAHQNYLQNPDNPPRPLLRRAVNGIAELAGKPPPVAGPRRWALYLRHPCCSARAWTM